MDSPETIVLQPLDILSKKPEPITYSQFIDNHRNNSTTASSLTDTNTDKTEKPSVRLLIQDLRTVHKNIDRDSVLQRLKTNGFLVNPCQDDKRYHKNVELDVQVDEIKPKVAKVNRDNIQYDVEKGNEKENPREGQKLKQRIILGENEHAKEKEDDNNNVDNDDVELDLLLNKDANKQPRTQVELPSENDDFAKFMNHSLSLNVDDETIFIVCNSKSSQNPPGKESGEKIPKSRVSHFDTLGKINNWREQLCNDFIKPFVLDDVTWSNVNHYYIASQYKQQSFFPDLAKHYPTALEVEKTKKFQKKKITVDNDFNERNRREMYHALYAKFTQHPELARLLHATKDATLLYRISPRKKAEFTELMWLRDSLRMYVEEVLKPLDENTKQDAVEKEGQEKEEDNRKMPKGKKMSTSDVNLKDVSIGEYQIQLPEYKPDVVRASSYFLNNRTQFIQSITQMFRHISSNPTSETGKNNSFDLLDHQRIVLNYLRGDRPYHGLLVYHNLGTGKSCTSIAVAEGMKHDKQIIVMLPASLKSNYWSELQKCGDYLYKQNQYWEFVSIEGRPDLVPVLAKALNLNTMDIRRQKGAYMVDVRKPPNFANLPPTDQVAIQEQIQHMINQKYKNIHYNANNLGQKLEELGRQKNRSNPFDHTVVILEEAHNFISRIVGNLRKNKKASNSVYIKLYEQMLSATDFRIVMLSGTPILNYPQEMGVMFNLLRGGITTWTYEIQSDDKLNTESINALLKKERVLTYDYLQYQYGKLVVTKNPYGFINVDQLRGTNQKTKRNQKQEKGKGEKAIGNKTRKQSVSNQGKEEPTLQSGGAGNYGVRQDKRGNVSNAQFEEMVKSILKKNNITIKKVSKKVEKCLPDNDTFLEKFITSTVDGITNVKDSDIININTLRRRILGLTSYYRTANKEVLPEIILNDENLPIHEVRVPMSDHQIEYYMKIRNQERDKEKKQLQRKRNANMAGLFETASSYRVFSRCACNFTFPNDLKRPIPKGNKGGDDGDGNNEQEVHEHTIEDNTPVEMAEYQDEEAGKSDDFYQQEIAHVMRKIREDRSTILDEAHLKQYSPKMLSIIQNLRDPRYKGCHLLYSAFRTLEGIGIFKEVLLANGYQEFKLTKQDGTWNFASDFEMDNRPCFVLYTGTEDVEMREIMRNIYNGDWNPPNVPESIGIKLREVSSNNLYGEIIQLFMITAAGAEGINLKNTRYVHMMEPYWNLVRLEQVMGRARRIKSHIDLPKDEQTVQTFLYLSVLSEEQKSGGQYKDITENDLSKIHENMPITTDEYLYEISQIKQKINKQLLTVMKETAMDCHVHIQEHKKDEKLICYGPRSGDKDFVDYPSLDKVLEEE